MAAVTALAAALLLGRPLVSAEQRVTVTGAPLAVYEEKPIPVSAGSTVCAQRVLLTPRTEIAQVVAERTPGGRPPLVATASGEGYRSGPVAVPAGPAERHEVQAPIDAPDRDVLGDVCLRNEGPQTVQLAGTEEFRSRTRLITQVDGEDVEPDLSLAFYADEPQSALSQLPGIVHRMTVGRGFLSADALVWFLLVLAFAGVPVVVFATWYRVLSRQGRQP
jgi:hypothetical protein